MFESGRKFGSEIGVEVEAHGLEVVSTEKSVVPIEEEDRVLD